MADSGENGGLAAALRLLAVSGGLVAEGGQADMFGASDAPLPLKGKSGPQGGRPMGARNRSTDEWARFLLAQYQSPLVVLAEIYSRDTAELTGELQAEADKHKKWRETKDGGHWTVVQVDPVAVLKLQRDAAMALAPYLHKQQPKAIEVDNKPRGITLLGDLIGEAVDADEGLARPYVRSEENQ